MFIYDTKLPLEARIIRPDMKYYLLLDHQLKGCSSGLKQMIVYIRQSFIISNLTFRDILMRLDTRQVSGTEVPNCIIHQMHGEDDCYYGESSGDTSVSEFIEPCHTQKEHCSCQPESEEEQHHMSNGLTAATMRDIQYEEEQIRIYGGLVCYTQDDGVDEAFSYPLNSAKKAMDTLRDLLHILTTHTEMKDFEEEDTYNAWDLGIPDYFDKLNPTSASPSDIGDSPSKKWYLPVQKKVGYMLKANSRHIPIVLQGVLLLCILNGYIRGYVGIGNSSLFFPLQFIYVILLMYYINGMLFLCNEDK